MACISNVTVTSSFINNGLPSNLSCPAGTTLRQMFTQYAPGQTLDGQTPTQNGQTYKWDDTVVNGARISSQPTDQKNGQS